MTPTVTISLAEYVALAHAASFVALTFTEIPVEQDQRCRTDDEALALMLATGLVVPIEQSGGPVADLCPDLRRALLASTATIREALGADNPLGPMLDRIETAIAGNNQAIAAIH